MAAATVVFLMALPLASAYRAMPSGKAQISAKGEEVWMVDNMQSIFRWNGIGWENIPGWATNVGASPDGWTWVISAHFSIQRWNPVKRTWDVMPGQGYQVNAISKDVAVVVGVDYAIYMWKFNGWTKIGVRAIWVSIGEREEVWTVNRFDGSLWQWRYPWLGLGGWFLDEGTAVQVDLQNSSRIVYRDETYNVYTREGGGWKQYIEYITIGTITEPTNPQIGSVSINKKSLAYIKMYVSVMNF